MTSLGGGKNNRENVKSLYESILGSNRANIKGAILDWCEKHITDGDRIVSVDDDCFINIKSRQQLIFKDIEEDVPQYIKFNPTDRQVFLEEYVNYFGYDQIPHTSSIIYINQGTTDTTVEPHLFVCGGLSMFMNKKATHIEPIVIRCGLDKSNGYRRVVLDLSHTNIPLRDLKNITVEGEVYTIDLKDSIMSKEIVRDIDKLKLKFKKDSEEYDNQLQKYLDNTFGHLTGLRFVDLTTRTNYEHNPLQNKWIKS